MDLQMNLNTDFVKWLDADGHIFEKKNLNSDTNHKAIEHGSVWNATYPFQK